MLQIRHLLKRSKVTLHGYDGHKLSNLGVYELECSHNGAIPNLQFHGVDGDRRFPEHSLTLHPDAKPVIHPPRRVPLALHDKDKQELVHMKKYDIITKVTEPINWVNSMVVVHKRNGELHVSRPL